MNLLDKMAYDSGGYTVQEILSSFCKKILEIIDVVNKNEEVCDEARTIIENIRNEVVPDLVDNIMEELQDNGYFDNLVNVTLHDNLRSELTTLLNQTITDYTTRLDNFDSQLDNIENGKAEKTEVQILKNRVDSFTSLDEGSTTGDAELIDGRNTFFGTTDKNIGESIRKQMNAVYNGIYYLDVAWELGEMDSSTGENGNTINPTQIRSKDFISIPLNVDIKFELSTNYHYFILKYNENKIYQGY